MAIIYTNQSSGAIRKAKKRKVHTELPSYRQ